MKQITSIYKHDIVRIARNWVAAVIILGLVFLPSLYAWFNIEASWDPYARTNGLQIAVANQDQGVTMRGKPLNIGNEIIASLKENHSIGWTFVDEEQALAGVNHGDYYASITIPADFSAKIATVLSGNPQKAEIEYFVNEKINAISPKIAAKGAGGVVDEVSRNFVKTANGTLFRIFNEIGVELETQLPTIDKVKTAISTMESMFPDVNKAVNSGLTDITKTEAIVQKAQSNLPIVASLAQEGEDFTNRLGTLLDRSSEAIDTIAPNIKADLLLLQQSAMAAEQLTAASQDAKIDPALIQAPLSRISQRLTTAIDVTDRMITLFQRLDGLSGGNRLTAATTKLQQIKGKLQQQLAIVGKIADTIQRGEKPADELVSGLNQLAKEADDAIGDILQRYDSEIQPQIVQGLNKAKLAAQKAHTVLADASKSMPDIEQLLSDASKGLSTGGRELQDIQNNLPAIEAKITALADRIRALEKEGSLNELIDLLKNNAEKESEFFAEPVILKENKLFPIPNYGSAMSPFFTTLSLWVGALLLVSLLTVEVHEPEMRYRSYHIYFGRYLTFLTLAILQSLMVSLGDLFILGTYVVDKLWFVLFGIVLSSVFMLIVYTLVSVFGNVGKAMAIVMLVLQLAGSGGTFPIQVTPPFFQAIHPLLPFTYGISMMREAAGGILWDIVARDLLMMCIFMAITLVIGLALKKFINQSSAKLIRKAKESKLIH